MRVVDDETELYFVFSLSHFSPAFWLLAFGYVLSSGAFLVEAFLRPIPKFRMCGLAGVCTLMLRWAQNQYILWRCGVKHDNCYVTEYSWMKSKYINYTEGNPFPSSKVKEYPLCQYLKFVTSVHLFKVDYSHEENNIFVPHVDTVARCLYRILAWHHRPTD